jgi:hypothetical protein
MTAASGTFTVPDGSMGIQIPKGATLITRAVKGFDSDGICVMR